MGQNQRESKCYAGVVLLTLFLLAGLVQAIAGKPAAAAEGLFVRNVILFVGDGMGAEHVHAARLYLGRPLFFESLPYQTTLTTDSVSGVTDSAASATALATGYQVYNGVVSVALPGDGAPRLTALEICQARDMRSGLVTTSYITDATPAAFAAHQPWRGQYSQIAEDYLAGTRPNLLLGGGGYGMTIPAAEAAGYAIVTNTAALAAVDVTAVSHLSGQFGIGEMPSVVDGRGELPTLAQMTETALAALESDPKGFFLVVEQEGTDTFAHSNDITRTVHAMIELEAAVAEVLTWAAGRSDTLIVVTSDHETGGLHVVADNGLGSLPDVIWQTTGHTPTPVPLYAAGPHADWLSSAESNRDLFSVLILCQSAPTAPAGARIVHSTNGAFSPTFFHTFSVLAGITVLVYILRR